ncbi:unnamed protein product [Rotaria sp. Silwood2]|nr:unnamed protein product [Rotaria sp. Silwood2]CAF3355607.1 unnamed protein product [Rotaria sp. Silwood2]CAF4240182.1 unnamed protein product [Rotaria sp. Silwood2]CAF4522426.1 unnamed protein product [Rotaria sp. Silwood2]
MSDSTIGIVGLGRIGLAIARRLQSMAIKKILYSGTRKKQFDSDEDKQLFSFVPFDQLLEESDFVIISCSLNSQTKNMFDSCAFKKMKKDAILINVSRGEIVDQDALYDALTTGKIAAAGNSNI